MGIKFNPFTGQFDIAGGSGGANTPANRYSQTFNATTDWGSAVGGYYSITILGATHMKEEEPIVTVFEQDGITSNYFEVDPDLINVDENNGDVTIRVPETPNLRFQGKIVII